jgi:enoyl-CoA hydratase/carnithine racemase
VSHIEYSLEDHIAVVRLNRPERLNAMSPEMGGLSDTDKPLIAAVSGFAIGMGWYTRGMPGPRRWRPR